MVVMQQLQLEWRVELCTPTEQKELGDPYADLLPWHAVRRAVLEAANLEEVES